MAAADSASPNLSHESPASSAPLGSSERPWWLRRHAPTLVVTLTIAAAMLYANMSGIPGLLRIDEDPVPAGLTVTKHFVYGWPLVTRQEIKGNNSSGGYNSLSTGNSLLNIPICGFLLLLAIYLMQRAGERTAYARMRAKLPSDEAERRVAEQRRAFTLRWRRVFRFLVAGVVCMAGAFIVYGSLLGERAVDSEYAMRVELDGRGTASSITAHDGGMAEPVLYAVGMLIGGAIFLSGVGLILLRFRLWMAVAAVLILGLLGSLPMLLAPKLSMKAQVSVGMGALLSSEHLAELRSKCSASAASSLAETLPRAIREQLPAAMGIQATELAGQARDGGPGVCLDITFAPGTTSDQRRLAFLVYEDYLLCLVERAAKAEGHAYQSAGGINFSATDWPDARDAWLKSQAADLDAAFGQP